MGNEHSSSSDEESSSPEHLKPHGSGNHAHGNTLTAESPNDSKLKSRGSFRKKGPGNPPRAPSPKPSSSNHHPSQSHQPHPQLNLTAIQIKTVQKFWRKLECRGKSYVGETIFEKIFRQNPEVRHIFDLHNLSDEWHEPHISYQYRLKGHYVKFYESLDFIIKHLDHVDLCAEKLVELGRLHTNFRAYGFSPKLWDRFGEAMIEATISWGERHKRTPESQEAWTKIVMFIIDRMKEGYYQELKKATFGRQGASAKDMHHEMHATSSAISIKQMEDELQNPHLTP